MNIRATRTSASDGGTFAQATAMLIGTIVGAGIFALPAATARAGFPVAAVWFVVLTALIVVIHTMFAEVTLRTPERHRLPGYVQRYLGSSAGRFALFSSIVGSIGALLVYLVVVGSFAHVLLPRIFPSEGAAAAWAWVLLAAAIAFGLRTVAQLELAMSFALVLLLGAIIVEAAMRVDPENFLSIGSARDAILPYGVILFALWGVAAIPQMRDLFGEDVRDFRRAVTVGTLVPALLSLAFSGTVVGAFGKGARGEIVAAIAPLGETMLRVLAAFGIVAVVTSFLTIGAYLVEMFRYDLRMPRVVALASLIAPIALYAAGAKDFLLLVSIIGAILGAFDGVLILAVWLRSRMDGGAPAINLSVPQPVVYAMMAMLLFGAGFSVLSTLERLLW